MDKKFYWLYITVFINVVGFGMIFPILPLFAKSLQASALQIGLIAATFSAVQFLFSPLLGKFSDKYGRKPILIFSIITTAIALSIIGLAQNLSQVFVGMAIQGLGTAGTFPTILAYIADVTSKENRVKYISRATGTFALGFMVGPVIGGFLGSSSFSTPFFVATFVGFINLLIIIFILPESLTHKNKELSVKDGIINIKPLINALKGKLGIFFFVLFVWAFFISNFFITVPLFAESILLFNPFQTGLLLSGVGLVAGITQWFVLPSLNRKIGEIKTILLSLFLLTIGQLIIPFTPTITLFVAAFAITVVGSAIIRPTANSILSKRTTEGQGATMGLAFSFESLARVIGPITLGFVITLFGVVVPFWITGMVSLLGLIVFWYVEMRK